ncbi:MAG: hypothetical protein ACXAC7_06115 [Candidatus Hodarchaeales archaeon]
MTKSIEAYISILIGIPLILFSLSWSTYAGEYQLIVLMITISSLLITISGILIIIERRKITRNYFISDSYRRKFFIILSGSLVGVIPSIAYSSVGILTALLWIPTLITFFIRRNELLRRYDKIKEKYPYEMDEPKKMEKFSQILLTYKQIPLKRLSKLLGFNEIIELENWLLESKFKGYTINDNQFEVTSQDDLDNSIDALLKSFDEDKMTKQ